MQNTSTELNMQAKGLHVFSTIKHRHFLMVSALNEQQTTKQRVQHKLQSLQQSEHFIQSFSHHSLGKKCSPIWVINHRAYLPYSNDKNSYGYPVLEILAGIGCHLVEGIPIPSAPPAERHCHQRDTLTECSQQASLPPPLAGAELPQEK